MTPSSEVLTAVIGMQFEADPETGATCLVMWNMDMCRILDDIPEPPRLPADHMAILDTPLSALLDTIPSGIIRPWCPLSTQIRIAMMCRMLDRKRERMEVPPMGAD